MKSPLARWDPVPQEGLAFTEGMNSSSQMHSHLYHPSCGNADSVWCVAFISTVSSTDLFSLPGYQVSQPLLFIKRKRQIKYPLKFFNKPIYT